MAGDWLALDRVAASATEWLQHVHLSAEIACYPWLKFGFKVRGVKIFACRWNAIQGSIQFPITYLASGKKKRVVHARGAHVVRLLEAPRRYAIEEGIYSKELLEHFEKYIQERREERKKQQEELVVAGQSE